MSEPAAICLGRNPEHGAAAAFTESVISATRTGLVSVVCRPEVQVWSALAPTGCPTGVIGLRFAREAEPWTSSLYATGSS